MFLKIDKPVYYGYKEKDREELSGYMFYMALYPLATGAELVQIQLAVGTSVNLKINRILNSSDSLAKLKNLKEVPQTEFEQHYSAVTGDFLSYLPKAV